MRSYLLSRSWQSAVSFCGLVVLVFFLARLTGSPADLYLPPEAPVSIREHFIEVHGLNDPVLVQFGRYLLDMATLDFGESIRLRRPAMDLVLEAFPTTLKLAGIAMSLALGVAIVTGALAAYRPNGIFDRLATMISLAAASIPSFWLAIVGVLIFAVQLRLVPTSGTGSIAQWMLPVFVLFVRPCGLIVQVVRASMLEALSSAYVKTARAKGGSNRSIIFVHALRNAMLAVVTVVGDQAAGMINGAVITEVIFAFPGVGKLMIDSITNRDFAVVQAAVMATAAAIFLMNVVIDVVYMLLDPRIRHD